MSIYWERVKAERRHKKLKMIFLGLAGAVGMWIIWNFVQIDFCKIYYQVKCF